MTVRLKFLQPLKRQLWQNPITMKELRARMRGNRAFMILTIYLALLALIESLVYLSFVINSRNPATELADLGEVLFIVVLVAQAFVVVLIAPVFTTGAITGEKEKQTFEILRTTLLTVPNLLLGKLISGLGYVLLLIFAAIPIQSLAFLFGGVTAAELFMTQTVLVITAINFALLGLCLSSWLRSTLAATVTTLAITFGSIIGGPLLFILLDGLLGFSLDEEWLYISNLGFSLGSMMDDYNYPDSIIYFGIYVALYTVGAGILFALTLYRLRQPTHN